MVFDFDYQPKFTQTVEYFASACQFFCGHFSQRKLPFRFETAHLGPLTASTSRYRAWNALHLSYLLC
ncbi:hypothetical protein F9C07_1198 [Aspergillus flavus]|uniref:Uncharacterized protein n=1 Tax=Aspergillus flavus (strain ATCC 200026 / FGSC A1120 / IAM 13836 / NRRL 3357 / JCM 12722 / SRRC 167) TaxID=332952 RepID=A0A7U2MR17_ASPFN|nr:hypothetical protein F9C07_1198 [Aspergillus flavus]